MGREDGGAATTADLERDRREAAAAELTARVTAQPDAIRAWDPLPPLPSEVLASTDAGRGIAGWVLRPGDLDRLPVLTATPPEDAAPPASDPLAAYRPDAGGVWPDDRLTLSWAELRRLVALHLETCARSMPRDKPWAFMQMRATAMRDGEVPLLVSEVLDR